MKMCFKCWAAALIGLVSFNGEAADISGILVYGIAQQIDAYDLESNQKRRALTLNGDEYGSIISNMARINSKVFLYSVAADKKRIYEFNLETNSHKYICEGFSPFFLEETNQIIFDRAVPGEARTALLIADYNNIENTKTEILSNVPGYKWVAFRMSEKEIVVTTDVRTSYLLNVETGSTKELPELSGCANPLFRSRTKQAMCANKGGNELYLIDIDNGKRDVIPFDKGDFPRQYIPEIDAVIIEAATAKFLPHPREQFDLWLYSFNGKGRQKLVENVASKMSGHLIFFPRNP